MLGNWEVRFWVLRLGPHSLQRAVESSLAIYQVTAQFPSLSVLASNQLEGSQSPWRYIADGIGKASKGEYLQQSRPRARIEF